MHLNPDQKTALDSDQPVPLVVDNRECVLISKEAYDQTFDGSSVSETYEAIERVLDQEGDPGLESYQLTPSVPCYPGG